jgi:hypothetical protein
MPLKFKRKNKILWPKSIWIKGKIRLMPISKLVSKEGWWESKRYLRLVLRSARSSSEETRQDKSTVNWCRCSLVLIFTPGNIDLLLQTTGATLFSILQSIMRWSWTRNLQITWTLNFWKSTSLMKV